MPQQPEKETWFKGIPKIYNLGNGKIPDKFIRVGDHLGETYFAFTSGKHSYVAKGQLTLSGKGFRHCALTIIPDMNVASTPKKAAEAAHYFK